MASVTSLFDVNVTFGALFVGFGASTLAFGVLCMQTYSYIRRYPSDVMFYKVLVAVLWLLELVDQALIGHAIYFYLVTSWGQIIVLFQEAIWSLILQVTLGAMVGAIVKTCFAIRVWRFSQRNVLVTGLIMLGTLAQLAAAFVFTVKSFKITSLVLVKNLKFIGTLSLGLGMATDIVTAIALCYFLRNLKTGYAKDDTIINKLTIYAINTGVLTSACSLCTLILYALMPDNFLFMGFYFLLSKLYANSFYAALNTRKSVRGKGTEGDHTTVPTFLMVGHASKPDYMTSQTMMRSEQLESGMKLEPQASFGLASPPPLHYNSAYNTLSPNNVPSRGFRPTISNGSSGYGKAF